MAPEMPVKPLSHCPLVIEGMNIWEPYDGNVIVRIRDIV